MKTFFYSTFSNEIFHINKNFEHSNQNFQFLTKINYYNTHLINFKPANIVFLPHNYKNIFMNYKNIFNIVYFAFLNNINILLFSSKYNKDELKTFNFYLNNSELPKKTSLIVLMDNFVRKRHLHFFEKYHTVIIKPVSKSTDIMVSSYPLYLNINTELHAYMYLQFIKYIFYKSTVERTQININMFFNSVNLIKKFNII